MSDIEDWYDLMPSLVGVELLLRVDDYGVPVYGPKATYRSRVNFYQHFVRGPSGEQVIAEGVVWIGTDADIPATARVTLPDGTSPLILKANGETDETGQQLYCRIDFG